VITGRPVTVEEVNNAFRPSAATPPLQGVLAVLEQEWASSRIVNDPHSSIADLPLTQVQEGVMLSVAAWYDSEMGFSSRLPETAARIAW
jgi:glyceraldehyde 3-phosphate dehydrogenase